MHKPNTLILTVFTKIEIILKSFSKCGLALLLLLICSIIIKMQQIKTLIHNDKTLIHNDAINNNIDTLYRILGNVCVVYILRISEKTRFCDFNFCKCKINY